MVWGFGSFPPAFSHKNEQGSLLSSQGNFIEFEISLHIYPSSQATWRSQPTSSFQPRSHRPPRATQRRRQYQLPHKQQQRRTAFHSHHPAWHVGCREDPYMIPHPVLNFHAEDPLDLWTTWRACGGLWQRRSTAVSRNPTDRKQRKTQRGRKREARQARCATCLHRPAALVYISMALRNLPSALNIPTGKQGIQN